ncbi:FHA domain-containing protein [Anaerolineales bacterium HSG6]|nr:FHA domain-containing protein [Anaerolineales bacterium HSG6]
MTDSHSNVTQAMPNMAPKLEVTRGKNMGILHKLKMVTRVGRELDNDVVLTDTKASRHHAEIFLQNEQWIITDLGSYNQTTVNGTPVTEPTALSDGDRIDIGETEFTFRASGQPQDAVSPPPTGATQSAPATETSQPNLFPLIAGGIVLLMLVAGAIVLYAMFQQPTTPNQPAMADSATPTVEQSASEPAQPTPTDEPLSLFEPPELSLVYEEDFSDSFSGWDDASDMYTRKVYGNNRYQVEVNTSNLVAWGLANRDVANFELEVEAQMEDGDPQNSYGLIFRVQDKDNFYRFDIANDQHYLLSKFFEEEWLTLKDWTFSENINPEGANILKISAFGPNISASINDHEVIAITDDSIVRGNFGFFAGTFDHPYMWVSFDDLKLWVPVGEEQTIVIIPTATRVLAPLVSAETATPTPVLATPTSASIASAETETETETAETTETPSADETVKTTETPSADETPDVDDETDETSDPSATLTPIPSPTITPTPIPLPEYVSRDQPLGRGQQAATGRIVFPLYDPANGTYHIYIADADGDNQELLQREASQPGVSKDGTELAYRSWQADRRGLMARPLSGGDEWHVTKFFEDGAPQFSPTSKTFMYHSRVGGEEPAIYSVVEGEGIVLRSGDGAPVQGQAPKWMNDEEFVFKGCVGGTCGLMRGSISGAVPSIITNELSDSKPELSPDGSTLIFMSQRDGDWNIYSTDLSGDNVVALTNDEANDGLPTWSPDGKNIAFVSNRDGEWSVWEMTPDGDDQRRLFELGGSPDGQVQHDVINSRGWTDETIAWIE